ncbi:MAG TPA: hypothetical protein VNS09_13815 [Solirubrobacter sp.]|nr:hypothetical protein [Solirubrobacter sp.]
MTFLVATALSVLAALPVADVEPRPALRLAGAIQFARPQEMTLTTARRDGSRLRVRMGFDGPCTGGGIGEVWVARVAARPVVRARGGSFDAALTGVSRNLGGVRGRTGQFRWRLTGRFVERDVAVATVTGSAVIKVGRRVVSRCRIAEPASVRLARR